MIAKEFSSLTLLTELPPPSTPLEKTTEKPIEKNNKEIHGIQIEDNNTYRLAQLTSNSQSKASQLQPCSCHTFGPSIRNHAYHHQPSYNTKPHSFPDIGLRDMTIPAPQFIVTLGIAPRPSLSVTHDVTYGHWFTHVDESPCNQRFTLTKRIRAEHMLVTTYSDLVKKFDNSSNPGRIITVQKSVDESQKTLALVDDVGIPFRDEFLEFFHSGPDPVDIPGYQRDVGDGFEGSFVLFGFLHGEQEERHGFACFAVYHVVAFVYAEALRTKIADFRRRNVDRESTGDCTQFLVLLKHVSESFQIIFVDVLPDLMVGVRSLGIDAELCANEFGLQFLLGYFLQMFEQGCLVFHVVNRDWWYVMFSLGCDYSGMHSCFGGSFLGVGDFHIFLIVVGNPRISVLGGDYVISFGFFISQSYSS
ncbi:hypothetical protein TNCV_131191 [Trichonephila clavipes]|nr:hypothetical protein TNCV_131191 [Trichonephila clavipes]